MAGSSRPVDKRDELGRFQKGIVPTNKLPDQYKRCEGCNTSFLVSKRNPKTRFCSFNCFSKWSKGKPKSPEHAANIRRNHVSYWKGKTMTPEHVTKMVVGLKKYQSGEKHWAWRGGVTPIQKKMRMTKAYKLWRTAVYTRDNYTCVLCGERGGTLNADHYPVAYVTIIDKEDWKLLYDTDNGRTLCFDCHKKTPNYGARGKVK